MRISYTREDCINGINYFKVDKATISFKSSSKLAIKPDIIIVKTHTKINKFKLKKVNTSL